MEQNEYDSDPSGDMGDSFVRSVVYGQMQASLLVLRCAEQLPLAFVNYHVAILRGIVNMYDNQMSLLQGDSTPDAQDIPTQGE